MRPISVMGSTVPTSLFPNIIDTRQVFLEMHLIVAAKDVETSHKITEEIEFLLEKKFAPIRIIIHVEPPNYESSNISFNSEDGNHNKTNV